MAETVKRFREPGAWLVLGASAVYIVLSLVRFVSGIAGHQGVTRAAHDVGGSSLSVVMVLALVAVALTCVLVKPATPRARQILRLAAVALALATVLEVVFVVVGLFAPLGGGALGRVLEVVGALVEVAVKAAGAHVLWRCASGAPAAVPPVAEDGSVPGKAATAAGSQAASWDASQAVGAVWARAGDAASGAAASTWGVAGRATSGWDVAAREPESPQVTPGPWATAGELAEGRAPAPSPLQDEVPGASNTVSWKPAARDE